MSYIGLKYGKVKRLWQVGVDYFDKTGDPTEMSWRPGAELIMDWECREPKDLGQGHWEEYKNNQWVKTNNIISAKDLDANSTEPNKVLRFVWDKIVEATGDAKRTGTLRLDGGARAPGLARVPGADHGDGIPGNQPVPRGGRAREELHRQGQREVGFHFGPGRLQHHLPQQGRIRGGQLL